MSWKEQLQTAWEDIQAEMPTGDDEEEVSEVGIDPGTAYSVVGGEDPQEVMNGMLDRMRSRIGQGIQVSRDGDPVATRVISEAVMGNNNATWLLMSGLVPSDQELTPEQAREVVAWAQKVQGEDKSFFVGTEVGVPEGDHGIQVFPDMIEAVSEDMVESVKVAVKQEALRMGAVRPASIAQDPHVGKGGFQCRTVGLTSVVRHRILADVVADHWDFVVKNISIGEFYMLAREGYQNPRSSVRAAQADNERGRKLRLVLGSIAEHDKAMSKVFGSRGYPVWRSKLSRSLVFNAKEDTMAGKVMEVFFSEVREAAAQIYLAALHKEGPLLGKPGEGWGLEAKLAGAIIGRYCRRTPEPVRKRLLQIAGDIQIPPEYEDWLKGKVFSLDTSFRESLNQAVVMENSRKDDLGKKNGMPRMRVLRI